MKKTLAEKFLQEFFSCQIPDTSHQNCDNKFNILNKFFCFKTRTFKTKIIIFTLSLLIAICYLLTANMFFAHKYNAIFIKLVNCFCIGKVLQYNISYCHLLERDVLDKRKS